MGKEPWQNFQIHPVLSTPLQKLDFFFLIWEKWWLVPLSGQLAKVRAAAPAWITTSASQSFITLGNLSWNAYWLIDWCQNHIFYFTQRFLYL